MTEPCFNAVPPRRASDFWAAEDLAAHERAAEALVLAENVSEAYNTYRAALEAYKQADEALKQALAEKTAAANAYALHVLELDAERLR